MKKKIIAVCALVTMTFVSSTLCLDFKNDKGVFLSMTNLEAISAKETACTVSSNDENNTGHCKKAVNNTGDVCVTPGFWDSINCNGHN